MTDFFTRLAQRTLGLASTVQPMLDSFYAPAADLGDNALLEIAVDEEVQNESTPGQQHTLLSEHNPVQPAAQAMTTTIQNFEPQARANAAGIQPEPARQVASPLAHYKDALSNAPTPGKASAAPLFSTVKAARLATATQVEQPHGALVESLPVTELVQDAKIPAAESLSVPTFVPQLPRRSVIDRAPTQQGDKISSHSTNPPVGAVVPRQPATGARTAATTSSRSTAEGKIPSRVLPEKKHQAQGESLPSIQEISTSVAPTIQVTIGRIEVRATPAPTSSAPSVESRPRSPAVMSLDDYLQQRAKGGR